MKRSTGLRNHLLVTGSLKSALDGKVINVYSGTPPASADEAVGAAVLLCVISVDALGGGVTLAASAANGQVTKNTSEVWEGEIVANGLASFFRMCTAADDNGASNTAVRIQGTIALSGGDLDFADTNFVSGNARRLNYFVVSVSAG